MLSALFNLTLGVLLGFLLLEGVLRSNSQLLLRGMALPAPIDAPISNRQYDVYYSDADEIFWRPDLFHPIPAGQNKLEAHVDYQTDEFGFRNTPPIPTKVDLVVLGRSISLGAQQPSPWPELFANRMNWKVWNLSQPGSGMDTKLDYLRRYALPRRPSWVVVEVQPAIDISQLEPSPSWLISSLPVQVLQYFLKPFFSPASFDPVPPIYPLKVDLPGRSIQLTCCLHYLEMQTVDAKTWQASQDWTFFSGYMNTLVAEARKQGTCVAILYAPSKPEIYFPLAINPDQLKPTLYGVVPLRLGQDGSLIADSEITPNVEELQKNALAGRNLLINYSRQQGVGLIDPSQAFTQSVLDGADPFMVYDSHWNETGHELVAKVAAQFFRDNPCR
ncbi:MAG: hypothetical protein P4L50_14115 [Anaerolineaceae bacterium]|nr:hypothetical protein [Anaerolineaceae bacterium]